MDGWKIADSLPERKAGSAVGIVPVDVFRGGPGEYCHRMPDTVQRPTARARVLGLVGTAAFGAVGMLLATVVRTSRSAQGIGLLLFFGMWLISGTGPPRAVLPSGLRDLSGVLPLSRLVTAVQDPWFGFGWSGTDLAVLAAYAVGAGAPALWFFRWD